MRASDSGDTGFGCAPECRLGNILLNISSRVLLLPKVHGSELQTILCCVDVKYAFRQLPVDPLERRRLGARWETTLWTSAVSLGDVEARASGPRVRLLLSVLSDGGWGGSRGAC